MAPTDPEHDLIAVITADHRAVEAVFVELEAGNHTAEHRRDLVDHAITELVRHSVAEEQFMYPAARRTLPGGERIVDEELSEHAQAEQTMKRLTDLDVGDPDFEPTLRELIADVRHHVEEEERDLLAELSRLCTADELTELGWKVTEAKRYAPTRPHPGAPDRPPGNLVLAPGTALVDRLRDAISGRSH